MKFLSFFFTLLFPVLVSAQIINIEDKRLGYKKDGWNGNIDFNLRYTQNTNSVWQFNNQASLLYRKDTSSHLIISNISLNRSNKSNLINAGFIHYRYGRKIPAVKQLKFECFNQYQYNSVQKIKFRFLAGTGLRVKVIGNDSINLNFGWSFMYEYEEITTPEFNHALRNSNYLSFNAKIGKDWSIKTIFYYQPNVLDFDDFRMSNNTSISHSLTSKISLVGTMSFLYDSRPPLEVPLNIFQGHILVRYKF